jgi:hypothetical protein
MTLPEEPADALAGAVALQEYLDRTQAALERHGLGAGRALLCLVTCPDELCDGARQAVRAAWGAVFDGAGLAGVPALGVAGFGAAAGHARLQEGRRRLVCMVLAHVGVGPGGRVGWCRRPGVERPSTACGALAHLASVLQSGRCPRTDDPDDPALGVLHAALRPRLGTARPDLWTLTLAALGAGPDLVERQLSLVGPSMALDYAIVAGLHVHGPDGRDLVRPAGQVVVAAGQRQEIDLAEH